MITIDVRTEKNTGTRFHLFFNEFDTLSMCGPNDDKDYAHVCVVTNDFYPDTFEQWCAYIIELTNKKLALTEQWS